MRGTAASPSGSIPCCRITPACAGNSWSHRTRLPRCRDHPRVCGDQYWRHLGVAAAAGSPPRVRGTVIIPAGDGVAVRITPACAGNSKLPATTSDKNKDHPRVCGEQLPALLAQFPAVGSPPRVRGTVSCRTPREASTGITPACAGNSTRGATAPGAGGDHPRVCGEQVDKLRQEGALEGSPPRVRGTE